MHLFNSISAKANWPDLLISIGEGETKHEYVLGGSGGMSEFFRPIRCWPALRFVRKGETV